MLPECSDFLFLRIEVSHPRAILRCSPAASTEAAIPIAAKNIMFAPLKYSCFISGKLFAGTGLKMLKWRKGHHLFVKTLLTSPVPMIPKRGRSKTGRSEVTFKAENNETCRTIIHRGKFKKSAKNLVKRRN